MSTNDDTSDDGLSDTIDELGSMGLETLSLSSPQLLSLPDELILVILDHSRNFYSSLKFALTCSKLWRFSHIALSRWWKELVTHDEINKALGRDFTKFDGVELVKNQLDFLVTFYRDRCFVLRSRKSAVEWSDLTFAQAHKTVYWQESPPAPGCKPKLMFKDKNGVWKWRVTEIALLCPNPFAEPQGTDESEHLLTLLTSASPERLEPS